MCVCVTCMAPPSCPLSPPSFVILVIHCPRICRVLSGAMTVLLENITHPCPAFCYHKIRPLRHFGQGQLYGTKASPCPQFPGSRMARSKLAQRLHLSPSWLSLGNSHFKNYWCFDGGLRCLSHGFKVTGLHPRKVLRHLLRTGQCEGTSTGPASE